MILINLLMRHLDFGIFVNKQNTLKKPEAKDLTLKQSELLC
jgi:hypothetical protein